MNNKIEEVLSSIDKKLALLDQRLIEHTKHDESNFSRLSIQIEDLSDKVDNLRLSDAERRGEKAVTNRNAGLLGGGVAAAVVTIAEVIKRFL